MQFNFLTVHIVLLTVCMDFSVLVKFVFYVMPFDETRNSKLQFLSSMTATLWTHKIMKSEHYKHQLIMETRNGVK
jgi:hypothetical protein